MTDRLMRVTLCALLLIQPWVLAACREDKPSRPSTAAPPTPPAATTPPADTLQVVAVDPGKLVDPQAGPELPDIPIQRGQAVGKATIDPADGGVVKTDDGLTLNFPAGSLDGAREVTVYKAEMPAPKMSVVTALGGEPLPVEFAGAWDVDVGAYEGLLPGAVELAFDLPPGPDGQPQIFAMPLITFDGKTWSTVPYELRDGKLILKTRHFSGTAIAILKGIGRGILSVSLTGLAEAFLKVGIPLMMVIGTAYIIYNNDNEFPRWCHPYAPFMSCNYGNPPGFDIRWSMKLPGCDPKTGWKAGVAGDFNDEIRKTTVAFLRDARRVLDDRNLDDAQKQAMHKQMFNDYVAAKDAIYAKFIPDKVMELRQSLVTAQNYIETERGFKRPFCTLPVYVVPTNNSEGALYNPWMGWRYILLGADTSAAKTNAIVLHELFHHYQTGYVWIDRTAHNGFMEASALLMEREAKPWYDAKSVPIDIQDACELGEFVTFRWGVDGPGSLFAWSNTPHRRHGYTMSWFLEYCRDTKFKGDPKDFHRKLMEFWSGKWTGAMHKVMSYAAAGCSDGNDETLGRAWIDFADKYVFTGVPARKGADTPFGRKHNCAPMFVDPASRPPDEYGLSEDCTIDFNKQSVFTLDDAKIRTWSMQFFKLIPPKRPNARLVIRIPDEWYTAKAPGREVFLRDTPTAWPAKQLRGIIQVRNTGQRVLDFKTPMWLYVVDTGQTGSGWVLDYQAGQAFLLEPPTAPKADVDEKAVKVKLSWKLPNDAAHRQKYYVGYNIFLCPTADVKDMPAKPFKFVEGDLDKAELDLTVGVGASDPLAGVERAGKFLRITTVSKVTRDGKEYIEQSLPSDPIELKNKQPEFPIAGTWVGRPAGVPVQMKVVIGGDGIGHYTMGSPEKIYFKAVWNEQKQLFDINIGGDEKTLRRTGGAFFSTMRRLSGERLQWFAPPVVLKREGARDAGKSDPDDPNRMLEEMMKNLPPGSLPPGVQMPGR